MKLEPEPVFIYVGVETFSGPRSQYDMAETYKEWVDTPAAPRSVLQRAAYIDRYTRQSMLHLYIRVKQSNASERAQGTRIQTTTVPERGV